MNKEQIARNKAQFVKSSHFERVELRPTINVFLTQKDIDDIMATALNSIGYWCGKVEIFGECLGKCASEQISHGGALILHEAKGNRAWKLTWAKFLNGMKLYFEQGCHVNVEDNTIDIGDIDANDADCIVQFALFGEVVFG